MLAKKYTIPMHSFVDLITNSSTEIYIEATDKTIESIKALVDNILKLGGSDLKCDDLFVIEIDEQEFEKRYEQSYEEYKKEDSWGDYKDVGLIVKCRDTNNELGKKTADVLAHLTRMFRIDAATEN